MCAFCVCAYVCVCVCVCVTCVCVCVCACICTCTIGTKHGTLSTDDEVLHVQVCPTRAQMEGAALQATICEKDELREENRQLKEKMCQLKRKLKDSERKMVSECERLRKQMAGDEIIVQVGEESLMDQIDELRTEVWARDEELEKELAHNVEHSRTMIIHKLVNCL